MWFVPAGCLTLLLAFALFVGGILLMVFNVMKASDVYRTAVHRAETDRQVATALGTPVTEGWWVSGDTSVYNDAGRVNLAIPVTGPKTKGTIYVVASKAEGVWAYVRVDGTGQIIDLCAPAQ